MDEVVLCSYGCGRKGIRQFKNGNYCCENHYMRCPIFRKPHTEEWKYKVSQTIKRSYTDEHREKTRKMMMGNSRRTGIPHDEKSKEKMRKAAKGKTKTKEHIEKIKKAFNVRPNQLEIKLSLLLGEEWRFVGDFSFWVGGKNPDFINEEKKLIIEFFGDYWHGKSWRQDKHKDFSTNEEHAHKRIEHFRKNGYSCLIIWEHELKDIMVLKEKIECFWNNNLKGE